MSFNTRTTHIQETRPTVCDRVQHHQLIIRYFHFGIEEDFRVERYNLWYGNMYFENQSVTYFVMVRDWFLTFFFHGTWSIFVIFMNENYSWKNLYYTYQWLITPAVGRLLAEWAQTFGPISERISGFIVNSFLPGQNGRHFADDVFKCIFLNKKFCILMQISLKSLR